MHDLESGPIIDKDIPNEELFVFMKEIVKNVIFYVKIKKDNTVNYDRIKIISQNMGGKMYEKNR